MFAAYEVSIHSISYKHGRCLEYQNVSKALTASRQKKTAAELWKCVHNATLYHVGGTLIKVGAILPRAGKKYMGEIAIGFESLLTPERLVESLVQAAVYL